MKRYQNPDVYERLALEYSLGTMQGRARERFKGLMQQHPFLQIVVEEYDHKFAELATYLPEKKPSKQVWMNIEAELDAQEKVDSSTTTSTANTTRHQIKKNDESHWWQIFSMKGFATAMASLVLLVSIVFVNMTQNVSNYSCELASENAKVMFIVLASKTDMNLKVSPMGDIEVPEGKQMHFWCLPKNPAEPIMRLGLVSKEGMKMQLSPQNWKGIEEAHMFGISFEPKNSKVTKPTGSLIYKGNIEALKQT